MHKAGPRRAFPLRVGSLKGLLEQLQALALHDVIEEEFIQKWSEQAWTLVCMHGCNSLHGFGGPLKEGGWSKAEKVAMRAIGGSVSRALCRGHASVPCDPKTIDELKKKRVNYQGEEVGVCHKLTLRQVLPALPPAEHGASIRAVDFLCEHSAYLMNNPEESILPDDGRTLPKLKGIIHAEPSEMKAIAQELVCRGVCGWIDLENVACYRGERILNGMFGVEKPSKIQTGEPILRLIMNLVPSNAILRQFTGATKNLPSITSWLSTVVSGEETIRFWQSDMCNAFYLFRIPQQWEPYLSFNHIEEYQHEITGEIRKRALTCRVLPMGWLSSVSIMQEISERILQVGSLDMTAQLVRNKPLPQWMVGIVKEARRTSRLWWHIYLDNFAAGQIISDQSDLNAGESLHQSAELAWSTAGVVSSEKKRASAISQVEELGAYVDGESGFMGGSPHRMLTLVQMTLWLIDQPRLSKKLVQVIAGRWVHVMQFRRPTMSIFEQLWKFTTKGFVKQKLELATRRELLLAVMLFPLMHTGLKTPISNLITASDASTKEGAVGYSESLTPVGQDFAHSLRALPSLAGSIPVLVISLFGGIGGAFRAYDLLGLLPAGLIHFDISSTANRVVSRRWPQAEIFTDVKLLDEALLDDILGRYPGIAEIHIWGGFPCIDLSSANARGTGLAGPQSSLFFELIRIHKVVKKKVGNRIKTKTIVENVASMKAEEEKKISDTLQQRPYFLDPCDAVATSLGCGTFPGDGDLA
eukprot:Skav224010  [mRNA]  locus=scaffold2932:91460:93807:+ [translate_table: standard]